MFLLQSNLGLKANIQVLNKKNTNEIGPNPFGFGPISSFYKCHIIKSCHVKVSLNVIAIHLFINLFSNRFPYLCFCFSGHLNKPVIG